MHWISLNGPHGEDYVEKDFVSDFEKTNGLWLIFFQ